MKNNLAPIFFLIVSLLSGCGNGAEGRRYQNLEEFRASTDSSWIYSIDGIPRDASDIEVRSDIESGLGILSYRTHERSFAIEHFGMNRLDPHLRADVVGGGVFDAKEMEEIYFFCYKNHSALGDEKGAKLVGEIVFVSDSGDSQYYWNSRSTTLYQKACGK